MYNLELVELICSYGCYIRAFVGKKIDMCCLCNGIVGCLVSMSLSKLHSRM